MRPDARAASLIAAVVLTAAAAACSSSSAPSAAAGAGKAELRYSVLLAGNHAGQAAVRAGDEGLWTIDYEFNDRGRGPKVTIQLALDRRGLPVREDVAGVDYFKNPVAEHFDWIEGKASWKNLSLIHI